MKWHVHVGELLNTVLQHRLGLGKFLVELACLTNIVFDDLIHILLVLIVHASFKKL